MLRLMIRKYYHLSYKQFMLTEHAAYKQINQPNEHVWAIPHSRTFHSSSMVSTHVQGSTELSKMQRKMAMQSQTKLCSTFNSYWYCVFSFQFAAHWIVLCQYWPNACAVKLRDIVVLYRAEKWCRNWVA